MISAHRNRKPCNKCRQLMDSSLSLCPFCASEQGKHSLRPATTPLPWNHEWGGDSPALSAEVIAAAEALTNKQRLKRIFGSRDGLNTLILTLLIIGPFFCLQVNQQKISPALLL